MPDNRSRYQKLEAVIAPNSGATESERENARRALGRMKPESRNDRPSSQPPYTRTTGGTDVNDFIRRYTTYFDMGDNFWTPSSEEEASSTFASNAARIAEEQARIYRNLEKCIVEGHVWGPWQRISAGSAYRYCQRCKHAEAR